MSDSSDYCTPSIFAVLPQSYRPLQEAIPPFAFGRGTYLAIQDGVAEELIDFVENKGC